MSIQKRILVKLQNLLNNCDEIWYKKSNNTFFGISDTAIISGIVVGEKVYKVDGIIYNQKSDKVYKYIEDNGYECITMKI